MSANPFMSAISSAKTGQGAESGWRDPAKAPPGIPLWVRVGHWIKTAVGWRVSDGWQDENGEPIEVTGWMPLPLPLVSVGRAA